MDKAAVTDKPVDWSEDQPIYRQLMDRLLERIIDQTYKEGDLLPSVRQLATDYGVNPLTAAKAYQELAKYKVTEKRRGIGFVVKSGVRDALLKRERNRFIKEEWPQIQERMERLGIDPEDLFQETTKKRK